MKKAIIFDLYGTLIDIHTDEESDLFWEQLSLFYGYSGAIYAFQELRDNYISEVGKIKSEIRNVEYPDIELLDVFKSLYGIKNVEVTDAKVKETASVFRLLSTDYITLYPYAVKLLEFLQESEYKVILLSNAQRYFTMNELILTGIEEYFDNIYISSDYKVCKPDPIFYNIMLENEKLKAEECIYIGNDHTTDIAGANRVGMDSIYLHTNCSQHILDEFDCKWKINPGNLEEVIEIIKSIQGR